MCLRQPERGSHSGRRRGPVTLGLLLAVAHSLSTHSTEVQHMNSSIGAWRHGVARLLAASLLLLGTSRVLLAQDGPSLIVLVRHAEKASATDPDPSLSEAGRARADALVATLRHAPPNWIVVTSRKRTAETAAPVAATFHVTPQVVSLDGGGAAHLSAVVEAVRKQRGTVLVVGHSNTVPALVKALGGPALPDLCDASYATLYVLQPARDSKPAQLVTGQYGASDPPGASGCAAMKTP